MLLPWLTAALAAPLPTEPPPDGPPPPPPGPEQPAFGADVSAGYAVGALLGEWPVAGPHGAFTFRYDAFIQTREAPGPRVGISLFGGRTLWPVPEREEVLDDGSIERAEFSYYHYGVMGAVRFEPAAPWGGAFSIGFSRLDLDDYYGAPLAVPLLLVEGGARRRLGPDGPLFLDLLARAGWASTAGQQGDWTDWFSAQLVVAMGMHVR
jgi:hypothetical protein